jgi:hypothetical protein
MKNLRITLLMLLIASSAGAQFFQRVYGSANSRDILESGTNYPVTTAVNGRGFLMAGYTNLGSSVGLTSVMLTRTNLSGIPIFNNRIAIMSATGAQLSAKGRKVITLANGQIAVWGDLYSGSSSTVTNASDLFFVMVTTAAGAPVYVRIYGVGGSPASVEATSIVQSPTNPADLYVTGNVTTSTGSRYPVVMNVLAANGNITWSHEYFDASNNAFEWTVEDLVESPYANPWTGQTDIALVGRYVLAAGGTGSGAFNTISAVTGQITSYLYRYGIPSTDAAFTAITIANNSFGGSAGYAIAGYSADPIVTAVQYSTWALKLSPAAQVQFSTTLDYSNPGRNDFGFDIIERVNTAGAYEYFVGGFVRGGYIGGEDELVYKLDFAGQPAPNGCEFTYGGPGNERTLQLDHYNFGFAANQIGFTAFGFTVNSFPILGGQDFHLVKSYFNGVTACNYVIDKWQYSPGPPILDSVKPDSVNHLKARALAWQVTTMQNGIICTANGVLGGDNARLANTSDEVPLTGTSLFPNPVSIENPVLSIQFETPGAGEDVEIEMLNSLGQLCLQSKEVLGDGQSQLQVNIGANGLLSKGIYVVVIRRGSEVFTHKISVQ